MQHHPRWSLLAVRILGAAMLLATLVVAGAPGRHTATPIQPAVSAIAVADATPLSAAVRLNPPRGLPLGETRVYVIGDSLTLGADVFGKVGAKLSAAGYQARVDGKVGRFIPEAATILQAEAAAGRLEPVVMAGLGTNEIEAGRSTVSIAASIDNLMTAVGNRWVIWINVKMRDQVSADRFNTILNAKAAQYRHLLIADWRSTSTSIYFQFDGIHLSPAGYVVRATFMVTTMNTDTVRN